MEHRVRERKKKKKKSSPYFLREFSTLVRVPLVQQGRQKEPSSRKATRVAPEPRQALLLQVQQPLSLLAS